MQSYFKMAYLARGSPNRFANHDPRTQGMVLSKPNPRTPTPKKCKKFGEPVRPCEPLGSPISVSLSIIVTKLVIPYVCLFQAMIFKWTETLRTCYRFKTLRMKSGIGFGGGRNLRLISPPPMIPSNFRQFFSNHQENFFGQCFTYS